MIDLHTHSIFSDGTYTPEQLIISTKELGLSAIALTDHNTIEGISSFLVAAEKYHIHAIQGIEISTAHHGIELHIVGLNIEPKHYEMLNEMLVQAKQNKSESNRNLIENLQNKLNYNISYADVENSNYGNSVNRANIAKYLVDKGYISSIEEGFQTILNVKSGYYIPPKRLDTLEVISKISGVGIISVMAHPFVNMNERQLEDFLPLAKNSGLCAMETYYSTYDEKTTELAMKLSLKYGLKESGGSDFHGENKPDIMLGIGRGNLNIPNTVLKTLIDDID